MQACDIPTRVNKDSVLDYNGRHILDICQSTGLLIANGRLYNDSNVGKFTFCGHRGQSTVDYLLLNFEDFESLSFFDILEFNEFSDHAPLSFHIRLDSKQESVNCRGKVKEPEITRKTVWDTEKVNDFKLLLRNNNDFILRLTADAASEPVDDTVKNLSQFLHDKAFEVFGKTFSNSNKSQKQKVNKEWFDETCKNARRDFTHARNVFNRSRNDQSRIIPMPALNITE